MNRAEQLRWKSLHCYYPNRRLRVLAKAIVRASRKRTGRARVLDVGCGVGVLGEWLTQKGIEYIGVDVDEEFCAFAQNRGLDVRCLDVRRVQGLGRFDFVVLSEVVEHVPEGLRLLLAVQRHITKDGRIFMSVPSLSVARAIKRILGRPGVKISEDEHLVEFSPTWLCPADGFWVSYRTLRCQVQQLGFEIVWRKAVGAFELPLAWADTVFRKVGPLPLDVADAVVGRLHRLVGCRYLCLGLRPARRSAEATSTKAISAAGALARP